MDMQDDLSMDSNDDGLSSNRTAKACDSCHRSKARCGGDGIHTCSACSRKGLECVYSMAKKRGPKSGALRAMQDEIEALRNQVRTLSNSSKARPGDDRESNAKAPPTKRARRTSGGPDSRPELVEEKLEEANSSAAPVYTPLPYAMFIPVLSEPRIAPLEMELRLIRLYFLYCNALLPMVCKTSFYHAGIRLGVLDMVNALCEETIPLCDHKGGDCATMTFIPFSIAKELVGNSSGVIDVPTLIAAAAAYRAKSNIAPDGTLAKAIEAASVVNGTRPRRPVTMTAQQLAALHTSQLPDHLKDTGASAPKQLSAAKACYYGVLAVGARMDMQPDRADAYIARCREALSLAWDEPCLETISACLLLGYYTCGCASSGDMLRSKCYVSLANEMADGLEVSTSAITRRAYQNAFSADNPDAVGPSSAEKRSHPPPRPEMAARARSSGVSARTQGTEGQSLPSVTAAASLEAGLPLDIVLSVRFMAQLTSAYRSASGQLFPRGDEWDSPRGKVSRILAHVTMKTRRRVSTPADLQSIAPSLFNALVEAEDIVIKNRCNGSMDFATLATIETSRAVVHHACGDFGRAFQCAEKALALMDNDFRRLTNYFVMGLFVQLIPVCMSAGHAECVAVVMNWLNDLARMWPVGQVLVAKAQRRIVYCTLGSNRSLQHSDVASASPHLAARKSMTGSQSMLDLNQQPQSLAPSPAPDSFSMRDNRSLTPLDHLAAVTETFAEPFHDGDDDAQNPSWTSAAANATPLSQYTVTPSGFNSLPGKNVVVGTSEASRNMCQYPSAHGVVGTSRPSRSGTIGDLGAIRGTPLSPHGYLGPHAHNNISSSIAASLADDSAFDFLVDDGFFESMPLPSPGGGFADISGMYRAPAAAESFPVAPAASLTEPFFAALTPVLTPMTSAGLTDDVTPFKLGGNHTLAAGPGSNLMMGRGGPPQKASDKFSAP